MNNDYQCVTMKKLPDNDIRSECPMIVSDDEFSPLHRAVQQREARRQRTTLKMGIVTKEETRRMKDFYRLSYFKISTK